MVFVWQVDNWGDGEPLNGFQSTGYFVADANNDIDLDNNGSGPAFQRHHVGHRDPDPGRRTAQ